MGRQRLITFDANHGNMEKMKSYPSADDEVKKNGVTGSFRQIRSAAEVDFEI
jgi:cytochrome oxidase Cu insertion factor (SCO1/SenC/PrrC family)